MGVQYKEDAGHLLCAQGVQKLRGKRYQQGIALFAAVIQISASFTVGVVGQNLVGLPSTDYAAHTIMNHATDYGNIRYEMGYASAICFVLFAAMLLANKGINWLLGKYLD